MTDGLRPFNIYDTYQNPGDEGTRGRREPGEGYVWGGTDTPPYLPPRKSVTVTPLTFEPGLRGEDRVLIQSFRVLAGGLTLFIVLFMGEGLRAERSFLEEVDREIRERKSSGWGEKEGREGRREGVRLETEPSPPPHMLRVALLVGLAESGVGVRLGGGGGKESSRQP